jgi:hypothetical protein
MAVPFFPLLFFLPLAFVVDPVALLECLSLWFEFLCCFSYCLRRSFKMQVSGRTHVPKPPAGPSCWSVAKQGFMMGAASGGCLGVVMGGGHALLRGGRGAVVLRTAGLVRELRCRGLN